MSNAPAYLDAARAAPMARQKELDLTGKVAIVTGASRGVGRQAALNFAKRGAKVVLAARTVDTDDTMPGSLGEAMQWIEATGRRGAGGEDRPRRPRRPSEPGRRARSSASAGSTSSSTTRR